MITSPVRISTICSGLCAIINILYA
jgi:hypothetical protein